MASSPRRRRTGNWSWYTRRVFCFLELRRELIGLGHNLSTYSDTEVILYAYRQWGDACVDRFSGMFAFTLWDRKEAAAFPVPATA